MADMQQGKEEGVNWLPASYYRYPLLTETATESALQPDDKACELDANLKGATDACELDANLKGATDACELDANLKGATDALSTATHSAFASDLALNSGPNPEFPTHLLRPDGIESHRTTWC